MSLETWAGPAWNELTSDQRDRLNRIAIEVDERYPDPDDQPLRDAALSAAVQYMLGETNVAAIGREFRHADQAREIAKAAATQVIRLADADGMAVTTITAEIGVNRGTVLNWLGRLK